MFAGQADTESAAVLRAEPLPLDIAFLAAHGIAPTLLREAAARAVTQGVPAAEIVLCHGLVPEEAFYRALADEAGLPFLPNLPQLGPGTAYPASMAAGIAPLDPVSAERNAAPRFVTAPRGPRIGDLVARRATRRGLAVTTPSALREAVFRREGVAIAHAAAHGLAEEAPHLSYRDEASLGQRLCVVGAAGPLAFCAVAAPVTSALFAAGLLGCLFMALCALRLATCLERSALPHAEKPGGELEEEGELPVYSIVVPLYREAAIVPRLVAALGRLDYPPAKLDIKLVVEADDPETRAALSACRLPSAFEILVAPAGLPRTKPRALNVALPLARGAFVVVYDAEDEPERDQLRRAVAAFAAHGSDVACLQARLAIDNTEDSWLARLFTIEYAALFDVVNPGLAALEMPVPLGGTSNHFRTEALRQLGGWDAFNVTEDADLGVRIALAGLRVADLASTTHEEAPARLNAWLAQRKRWMKGYMQVCITHSRNPAAALRRLGPVRFAAALALTFGTVVSALGMPLFAAGLVLALAAGIPLGDGFAGASITALGTVVAGCGFVSMLAPPLLGLRRRRWSALAPWIALMPAYYILVSIAAWQGLFDLLVRPSVWDKTEHGLARTSRRAGARER